MPETWLPHLTTQTPQAGFDLAIKLAGMAVKKTHPDETLREVLRPRYASDAGDLIAASHVVAVHFAMIAAANDCWRTPS